MKAKRQSLIQKHIEEGSIFSQEDAVKLLQKEGINATQTTISRDFEEIGAVKIRSDETTRYALIDKSSTYGASLRTVLKEYVIDKQYSANMIVLKTPPGHAQVVAAALDRNEISGLMGTIAGDDTIFLCINEKIGGKKFLKHLDDLGNT